ncbi:lysophospholipase [Phakopsora pachyrhizi]|uniref:Lysophospholipase n=1 Tax=Phakopsora pachyrhizi TaxID=170000 RepID=A0AAV0BG46_PHAPC|nr:lysophospholipase [Phakopsora pachyrhizi]CAH7686264.1 lysophospholipase [Phakopsora pachyrhizi]
MNTTLFKIFLLFALVVVVHSIPQGRRLHRRDPAIRDSPSGGYSPVWVDCPEDLTVRLPTVDGPLASKEEQYILERTKKSLPYWRAYLSHAGLDDFEIENFLNRAMTEGPVPGVTLPNIGMSLSGGGVRASLIAASVVNALDSRNSESVQAGTGGIIQLMNYVCGLSGQVFIHFSRPKGSWFTGSWSTSNFPQARKLVDTWNLNSKNQPFDWNTMKAYPRAIKIAMKKAKAGFPASMVDVWSLMVGKHFVNAPDYGQSVLFSSIQKVPAFQNHDAPFPIIVATSRGDKGRSEITLQTPIYEFTPYEFGEWHPSLNAFIPIEYLGTSMFGGKVIPHNACARGFDNAGFVMGSSSNILSEPFMPRRHLSFWTSLFAHFFEYVTAHMYDEALISNPFNGLGTGFGPRSGFPDGKDSLLYLADGGMAGENMPIWPLLQHPRKVDCIFAVDAQADGGGHFLSHPGYSNGTSLYTTYKKTTLPDYSNYHFPKIPDPHKEFSELGLDKRPSFFGCNETKAPLVIYFPNYYLVAEADFITTHASYTKGEINDVMANGFAIVTQKAGRVNDDMILSSNLTDELNFAGRKILPRWSTCLACALIDRQLQRSGIRRSNQCESCFQQHCN